MVGALTYVCRAPRGNVRHTLHYWIVHGCLGTQYYLRSTKATGNIMWWALSTRVMAMAGAQRMSLDASCSYALYCESATAIENQLFLTSFVRGRQRDHFLELTTHWGYYGEG